MQFRGVSHAPPGPCCEGAGSVDEERLPCQLLPALDACLQRPCLPPMMCSSSTLYTDSPHEACSVLFCVFSVQHPALPGPCCAERRRPPPHCKSPSLYRHAQAVGASGHGVRLEHSVTRLNFMGLAGWPWTAAAPRRPLARESCRRRQWSRSAVS